MPIVAICVQLTKYSYILGTPIHSYDSHSPDVTRPRPSDPSFASIMSNRSSSCPGKICASAS